MSDPLARDYIRDTHPVSHSWGDYLLIRQECAAFVCASMVNWMVRRGRPEAKAAITDAIQIMDHCFGVALTLLKGHVMPLQTSYREVSDCDYQ